MDDVNQFRALLVSLRSPEDAVRDPAEAAFKEAKASNPSAVAVACVKLMASAVDDAAVKPDARYAAVLLRGMFVGKKQKDTVAKLNEAAQAALKGDLLAVALKEEKASQRRTYCEALSMVAISFCKAGT